MEEKYVTLAQLGPGVRLLASKKSFIIAKKEDGHYKNAYYYSDLIAALKGYIRYASKFALLEDERIPKVKLLIQRIEQFEAKIEHLALQIKEELKKHAPEDLPPIVLPGKTDDATPGAA